MVPVRLACLSTAFLPLQNPELAVSTMAITENITTLLFMLPGSLGNAVRSVVAPA